MNRHLTYVIGPETILTLVSIALFWFCARHNSGVGRDVALMEKLIWLLPLVVTPLAFGTILAPGAKTWWWLGRAIVVTYMVLLICGGRLITGLGSGAKGQDAAFILIIVFGTAVIALATAICGAMILAELKPAFANWFNAHKFLGALLTLLAAVPIGFVFGLAVTFGGGILLGLYSAIFKR